MNGGIKRPRGTRDLYGEELRRMQEICGVIGDVFVAYGYEEMQTPTFEYPEVFEANDGDLLRANKEFFNIKSRDSEEVGYVLRPENTAAIARSVVENKLINRQVNHPLRYWYKGYFYRYERPQSGRFRQFMQMGVEKINAAGIEEDLENMLMVRDIQERLELKLTLRVNYLGGKETKERWNRSLREYFGGYREQLTEISRRRLEGNPMRILDDRVDGSKDFVKGAPGVEEHLSEQERKNVENIRRMMGELGIEAVWDSGLVRGIDYYTGLVYEWVDEKEGITVVAGGRYDDLLERFGYERTPSVGLAMGIERIGMILEREGRTLEGGPERLVYLYPRGEPGGIYWRWAEEIRRFLGDRGGVRCVVSYRCMAEEKHRKLANKLGKGGMIMIIGGENRQLNEEERERQREDIVRAMYSL